jgi:hypothetical protein
MLLVLELQDALPPRLSQFAVAFRLRQASTQSSQAWQPPAVQVHNGIESAPHRRDDTGATDSALRSKVVRTSSAFNAVGTVARGPSAKVLTRAEWPAEVHAQLTSVSFSRARSMKGSSARAPVASTAASASSSAFCAAAIFPGPSEASRASARTR